MTKTNRFSPNWRIYAIENSRLISEYINDVPNCLSNIFTPTSSKPNRNSPLLLPSSHSLTSLRTVTAPKRYLLEVRDDLTLTDESILSKVTTKNRRKASVHLLPHTVSEHIRTVGTASRVSRNHTKRPGSEESCHFDTYRSDVDGKLFTQTNVGLESRKTSHMLDITHQVDYHKTEYKFNNIWVEKPKYQREDKLLAALVLPYEIMIKLLPGLNFYPVDRYNKKYPQFRTSSRLMDMKTMNSFTSAVMTSQKFYSEVFSKYFRLTLSSKVELYRKNTHHITTGPRQTSLPDHYYIKPNPIGIKIPDILVPLDNDDMSHRNAKHHSDESEGAHAHTKRGRHEAAPSLSTAIGHAENEERHKNESYVPVKTWQNTSETHHQNPADSGVDNDKLILEYDRLLHEHVLIQQSPGQSSHSIIIQILRGILILKPSHHNRHSKPLPSSHPNRKHIYSLESSAFRNHSQTTKRTRFVHHHVDELPQVSRYCNASDFIQTSGGQTTINFHDGWTVVIFDGLSKINRVTYLDNKSIARAAELLQHDINDSYGLAKALLSYSHDIMTFTRVGNHLVQVSIEVERLGVMKRGLVESKLNKELMALNELKTYRTSKSQERYQIIPSKLLTSVNM